MKILDLILCHKWYDMIKSGEKPEEYREETAHWCSRICKYGRVKRGFGKKNICNIDCNVQLPSCKAVVPADITHVRLHRGYTQTTMLKEVAGISRGKGKAKWGAPDHETFIIKFRKAMIYSFNGYQFGFDEFGCAVCTYNGERSELDPLL